MTAVVLLTLLGAMASLAVPVPAQAGSEDAALALGAFAVFNQLVRGDTILHDPFGRRRDTVVIHQPPAVIYAPPPPVVVVPPPPPPVVVYPGGQWIAQHGHWLWVPNGYAPHYNGYAYKHHHKHHKKYWKRYKKHDDDD